MSVDVASLIFEIDSTQAVTARERLQDLEQAGARVDAVARKVKTATELAGVGVKSVSDNSVRGARAATEHANSLGAVATATRSAEAAATKAAEREAAAWAKIKDALERRNAAYRGDIAVQTAVAGQQAALKQAAALEKIDAILERRNAKLRGDLAAQSMREEAAAAGALESRIERLMGSIDPARIAQARLNAEMVEATNLYRMGAISASDYARATSILDAKMSEVARSQGIVAGTFGGTGKGAKLAAHEIANLGAQFTDIGVSLASGQKPWMVAIQQGAQIGAVFGTAAGRGVGFSAALKGVADSARPIAVVLGPVALAVGAAAAGFGLLNRELEKGYPTDITDGLGLTADQLERVEQRTVTMGDTWSATLDVMAKYLLMGPLSEAIGAFDKRWNSFLDELGANTANEVANIIGFFLGAYRSITNLWSAFPAAFGDIAAMAVNLAIGAIELWINANIKAFNTILEVGSALTGKMLPRIPEADLSGFKQDVSGAAGFVRQAIGANMAQSVADVKRGMGQIGSEIRQGAIASARAAALKEAGDPKKIADSTKAANDAARDAERELERLTKAAEAYVAQLEKQNSAVGRSAIQLKEMEIAAARAAAPTLALKIAISEQGDYAIGFMKAADAIKEINKDLIDTPAYLHEMGRKLETTEDRARALADAFGDVQYSLRDMIRSMKSGDIGGFLLNIDSMVKGLGTLLSQGPAGILSLGSMAANAIGGKGGKAVGGGLGLAASGLGLGAFASTAAGATALGTAGLGASVIGAIASFAGPIGIAAGALYAAAKLFSIGGKKSNAGAGFDLITGAYSGKSRTEETEQAAKAAGDAILQAQEMLRASGVTLGATVNGLVVGTRDLSQIYLSNGKTLTSAVGDSAAAVDAALRGILDGATYQSDAQKKLVESALAAGKGLDELAGILGAFEQAQSITKNLADEILKLTDPQAYDLKAIERDIDAQRDAAKAAAAAGYLTADQLTTINAQLATLKGLRIDEVMNGGSSSAVQSRQDMIESAERQLADVYERSAGAVEKYRDKFQGWADSIKAFNNSLSTGPSAMLSPEAQYEATRAAYEKTKAAVATGDEKALADLPKVFQEFVDASLAYNGVSASYFADLADVKLATQAAENYAQQQVSQADQQLLVLKQQYEAEMGTQQAALSILDAIRILNSARAGQALGANPAANAALASATGYSGDFGSGGWQAWIVAQTDATKAIAREILHSYGQDQRIVGFAGGTEASPSGVAWVGERGPELADLPGGTQIVPNHLLGQNDNSDVVAELREVKAELAAVKGELQASIRQTGLAHAAADKKRDQQIEGIDDVRRAVANSGRTR